MFFSPVLVLVEGIEDAAFLQTHLHLRSQVEEFRRLGCHVVAADGKSHLPALIAIAAELAIPTFVICDADTGEKNSDKRSKHETDNRAILTLLGHPNATPMPSADLILDNIVMFSDCMSRSVEPGFGGALEEARNAVRSRDKNFDGRLNKSPLFIGDVLAELAETKNLYSPSLDEICARLLTFAKRSRPRQTLATEVQGPIAASA